ncbi:MAG: hypothetical protein WCG47_15435 [Dermatophilaceae bacterium]
MSPARAGGKGGPAKKLPTGVRRRVLADGTVRFDARWRDVCGKEVMTSHATAEDAETARFEAIRAMRHGGTGPAARPSSLIGWRTYWETRIGRKTVRASTLP